MSRPLTRRVGEERNSSSRAVASVSTSVFRTITSTPAALRTCPIDSSATARLASVPLQRVQTSRSRKRKSISTLFDSRLCVICVTFASPAVARAWSLLKETGERAKGRKNGSVGGEFLWYLAFATAGALLASYAYAAVLAIC